MKYSTSLNFSGNEAVALETIQAVLLPNGFRLIQISDQKIELKGRGMNSSKENPLRGATEISVEIGDGEIRLDSQLGGVRFMMLFLLLFPLSMLTFLVIAAYFSGSLEANLQEFKSGSWHAIWIVILPLFSFWIRKRTVDALDDLLGNAVIKAGR